MNREQALTDFAFAYYNGAKDTLLALQDRHGASVAFCLYLIWLVRLGEQPADQDAARALAHDWEEKHLSPFRGQRRALKEAALLHDHDREAIYTKALETELAMEVALLRLLALQPVTKDAANALPDYLATLPNPEGARVLAQQLLDA